MEARTARGATGVVVGVLIEWHVIAGVRIAEDIAALATVVPAVEVVEVTHAGWLIADRGLGVKLPVLACGRSCRFWESVQVEVFLIHVIVQTFAAVVCLAAGDSAKRAEPTQRKKAAVAGWSGRAGLVIGLGLGSSGGVLVGP